MLMETAKITAARSVERRLTGLYTVHRPGQRVLRGRGYGAARGCRFKVREGKCGMERTAVQGQGVRVWVHYGFFRGVR